MSAHSALADFVAGLLDPEETWSSAFTVERVWRPRADPGDLASPVVSVAPLSAEREPFTRAHDQVDYVVGVMLRKLLAAPGDPDDEIDGLDALADELIAAVNRKHPEGVGFLGVNRDPVMAVEDFDAHQIFTTVIQITYRAHSAT